MRPVLALLVLLAAVPCLAQQGLGNECTLTGTWYGGSVVAYHMNVIPAGPAGQYVVTAQGMYKNSVMNTVYTGTLVKNGKLYEGSMMSLSTNDPDFLNPPPIGKLPDILAGWSSVEMVDCNTIKNTIPVFGIYTGALIWQPGSPGTGVNWIPNAKVPLVDAPNVDLIPILGGGKPIVETYHRLPQTVNSTLLPPTAPTPPAVTGPVANAGKNFTAVNRMTRLDGSASTGDRLVYAWRSVGNKAAILAANAATPTVQLQAGKGDYVFELTVTDSNGTQSTATVVVSYYGT